MIQVLENLYLITDSQKCKYSSITKLFELFKTFDWSKLTIVAFVFHWSKFSSVSATKTCRISGILSARQSIGWLQKTAIASYAIIIYSWLLRRHAYVFSQVSDLSRQSCDLYTPNQCLRLKFVLKNGTPSFFD